MTTQTPTPTDSERLARLEDISAQQNDRLARLEDVVSQQNELIARLEGVVGQLVERVGSLERSVESLRNMLFIGFGLMWATMVGGFIAILTFSS